MKRLAFFLLPLAICTFISCRKTDSHEQLLKKLGLNPVLLSNGWTLSPVGRQLPIGDLPLNMAISPDSSFIAITHNGVSEQGIMIYDVERQLISDTLSINRAWVGLDFSPSGDLFASGGNDNRVWVYGLNEGKLNLKDSVVFGRPWPQDTLSITGLEVTSDVLYSLTKDSKELLVYDLGKKILKQRVQLGGEAYACLLSPNGEELVISLWGSKSLVVYNLSSQTLTDTIEVGSHPNDMAFHPDGSRLFVSNANDNTVTVVDISQKKSIETLTTSLYPDAPAGSTSNSVAVSEDGEYLYVANADNNCLVVFEVAEKEESRCLGYIPTAWYPTSVRLIKQQLYVSNGKGLNSMANPKGPVPGVRRTAETQYIGSLLKGCLSIIDLPNEQLLKDYSSIVVANTPYSKEWEEKAQIPEGNPIPAKVGDPSPIKYVFYVIKENRTYDQVLGDMPQGKGDVSICLFPDSVTPNQHKLAREFVLLDNFYVDAEVSADGHNWSTAAYANDYTEKTWPTLYSRRGGTYDYEGLRPIAWPDEGFIWDYCERAGIPFRSYGEFVWGDTSFYESVRNNCDEDFPSYNLRIMDTTRFYKWKQDFDSLLKINQVPRFSTIRMGNDHTAGAREDFPTPSAMVADNDLAVGLLVDYISHSPIWKESAIFVLEDDAQNGADHVDAHRSILFVASPYTKRKHHESTMYSTCSVLRTMELILGLPPMSQYDAGATPLWACFQETADLTSFDHVANNIPLDQMNAAPEELSLETLPWNLEKEDAAPDIAFNRNIWRTVRGLNSEMPHPRRAAFVLTAEEEEEE